MSSNHEAKKKERLSSIEGKPLFIARRRLSHIKETLPSFVNNTIYSPIHSTMSLGEEAFYISCISCNFL